MIQVQHSTVSTTLYNWHQLAPLLSSSKNQALGHLQEIKDLASDGDLQGVLATVAELEPMFEGGQNFLDKCPMTNDFPHISIF